MVSAFCAGDQVVLGQLKTFEKSNEIAVIPELLQLFELKGCLVTLDAMGCQQKIAQAILKKKADYLLAVKGNQGKLAGAFDNCIPPRCGWESAMILTVHRKNVMADWKPVPVLPVMIYRMTGQR